jgi:hypothetical protein
MQIHAMKLSPAKMREKISVVLEFVQLQFSFREGLVWRPPPPSWRVTHELWGFSADKPKHINQNEFQIQHLFDKH